VLTIGRSTLEKRVQAMNKLILDAEKTHLIELTVREICDILNGEDDANFDTILYIAQGEVRRGNGEQFVVIKIVP
jgi:hypothetical protein